MNSPSKYSVEKLSKPIRTKNKKSSLILHYLPFHLIGHPKVAFPRRFHALPNCNIDARDEFFESGIRWNFPTVFLGFPADHEINHLPGNVHASEGKRANLRRAGEDRDQPIRPTINRGNILHLNCLNGGEFNKKNEKVLNAGWISITKSPMVFELFNFHTTISNIDVSVCQ
jgi:hypothetical protein